MKKINIDKIYNRDEEVNFIPRNDYLSIYQGIEEVFSPKSLADMGCRCGHLISLFKEHNGGEVLGVDYFNWNKEASDPSIQDNFLVWDLRDPLPNSYPTYDVVISTEVAEHIDPDYTLNYLNNLKSLMGGDSKLIISWSGGAKGTQHLNPLEQEDFFNFLSQNGLEVDAILTTQFRNSIKDTPLYWYLSSSISVWNKI